MHSTNGTIIDPTLTATRLCRRNDGNFVVAAALADADCIDSDFSHDSEIHRMSRCHFYQYFPEQWIVCTPIFFNMIRTTVFSLKNIQHNLEKKVFFAKHIWLKKLGLGSECGFVKRARGAKRENGTNKKLVDSEYSIADVTNDEL